MARPNAGIAFSGGGSRSATASFGIMRALHSMGMDKQFRYIGANSGGAWFVTAYSFIPPELSDEEFFGDYLDFPSIDNFDDVRESVESSAFLRAMTFGGIGRKAAIGYKGYANNRDENWSRAIGQSILAPLGLFNSMHPFDSQLNPGSELQRRGWDHIKWFTWSEETLDDILEDNPTLEEDDFDIVNRPRPYPILVGGMCSAGRYKRISGDSGHALSQNQQAFIDHFYDEEFDARAECYNEHLTMDGKNLPWQNMSLLEMTPMYTGVPVPSEERGGFFMESFGFDSELRQVVSENELVVDSRVLSRNNDGRSQRFSVADIMGITGSAMGWVLQGTPGKVTDKTDLKAERGGGLFDMSLLEDITCPAIVHWQPQLHPIGQEIKRGQSKVSRAVDGGFMDNFGLMPLLARRVKKIVICLNSDTPIRIDDDITEMIPNIEHFFGVVDRVYGSTGFGSRGRNQVFENIPTNPMYDDCVEEMVEGIRNNRDQHGVSFFVSSYKVLQNRNYGIEPYDVEVFWYFTETSPMSEAVIDALEADYDNILGYETTVDDYDINSLLLKELILESLHDVRLMEGRDEGIVNGLADSFVTSQVAANSIFGEDWDHLGLKLISGFEGDEGVLGSIADMLQNNGFPHYNTQVRLSLSAEEVGLLANYTHWSFLQLESHLKNFLGSTTVTDGKPDSAPSLKSKNGTMQRRMMRDTSSQRQRDERIALRKQQRLDDREFYGDADIELNEEIAFEEEEALLEGRPSRFRQIKASQPLTQTENNSTGFDVIQLKNAIVDQEYTLDISNMAEDPDEDDVLTFSKVHGPNWANIEPDGEVWGTPKKTDIGVNRFVFRVTDMEGESADAEVVINVESGNKPPRWRVNLG